MKTHGGIKCIDPRFLDLGTSLRWVVSFKLQPPYSRGKSPWYPLDRRQGGPQSRSRRRGENSWLHRNSNSNPLTVQPVASRYTDCAIPPSLLLVLIQPLFFKAAGGDCLRRQIWRKLVWKDILGQNAQEINYISVPFSAYFSYFEKIKVGLWDHVAVRVCVRVSPPPLSLLDNGTVKIPLSLLGNSSVKILLSLIGNGSVKIPLSLQVNGSVETLPR
jgi:hypothetical protein